ncbi:ninein-like protein isoform X2 [Paralichthys olivaceus]|uniref:ninein-like protein isoform X2 n=1 Tax=Paralichthys olivaceus TaxID=8255 RepID=UPI003753001D
MYCSTGLMSGCGLLTWGKTDRTRTDSGTFCYTQTQTLLEEHSARSTSPSLLTATVGQKVLSRLDDGAGCTSPERVIALWMEEGIRNSRDILQTLDFPLEERLSLADLTLALDNELLVSGNGIQQAALISYKNEIQHLQVMAEQACRERDKVRADLDLADRRNLKLVREVDDRHASMESLNQSRIRDLELDFRDRLATLRTQSEQESEALLQQVERERSILQGELQLLRVQEAQLQEELCSVAQENSRLEDELSVVKMKLTEAENSVNKLQRDMKQLLHDKFGGLDPVGAGLSHEERFCEAVKEYELQFRELRDRNDELSSELELLKSQRSNRKSRRDGDNDDAALSWTEQHSVSAESDSDDSDMKRHSSPLVKKKLQLDDKTGLDSVSGPVVSIQTELALEQLKQKHSQELQQLHIQLDTQVNYYERSLELMRQSMEVERKDISQAFKLEISELEEHKAQAEAQVKQLKEALDKLQTPHGGGGGGGWSSEQERRVQRERAELEQNFAREIGNLVQRLSAEKDQLEAELKLQMDQEVMVVREESEHQLREMKLQHAEFQRRLLHQLHRERQRLQEQRAFWEKRLEEERSAICGRFSSEKKNLKEQHEEAALQLREQVFCLQEAAQSADLRIGQSEARLKEFRERCGQLEDDVDASSGRCSELEARLEEACAQLEESITFLESHEVVSKRLAAEKSSMEEELQQARTREEQLLDQVTQLKEELGNVQAASDSILQDRELVADNCSRLSNSFVQLQAQLRARDQTVATLRSELENLQDAMTTKAAELDSLKTDRARLIQDLKEQAMAVDNLQLQLDEVSEELDRRRSLDQQLQGVLKKEQTRTSLLQSGLDEEKEEVCRLSQENSGYIRLADQLSTQIVEMEEEISTLRDHLRDLSSQLNETADLVLDLRRQLNSKTSEVDQLQAEVADSAGLLRHVKSSSETQSSNVQLEAKDGELDRVQVQGLLQALQVSQDQLRTSEEEFEEEKRKMRQQLMELEQLVLALEEVTESPHRTQLEELRSENVALQERLNVLQPEVQNLEDDVAKRRRKLDEMEREHERSREEEEKLHRENSKYREEVLDLSSRNLQLSSDNAELSARLRGDQESVRMLGERLTTVSKEKEEEAAMVRRLQEAATQQGREKIQQQTSWTQERHLLEKELNSCKDKLGRLSELEAELSAVTLKLQWSEEDKAKLLREADDRNHKVEKLQQLLLALESEAELLRSQLHAVSREKLGHAQEVTDLQRALDDARNKVEELERSIRKLVMEKDELCRSLEEQASIALQEESHRLRVQKQELQHKMTELQLQSVDVHKLTEEQQKLKNKVSELEVERTQAENQAWWADSALSVAQAQHTRQLQEVQERAGGGSMEQLQVQLLEEQRRSQQLEETLKLQAQQSSSQISVKQDQYEKAVASLERRTEDLELKLKAVRSVLQEKVQELKEQMAKNAKSSVMLKDLYVENSQLMKVLQVTEQRQKKAEKNNFLLKEKVGALNRLLREIVPVSLAT